ncbi:hypothetical protein CRG98_040588 [Punica granatum]|uniref:DUF7745 domain-containing protein n=1 Tax=Punica granatum TaxID=22663 RepID=A0A2I0I4X4_PUNGR|nr:hypothetical protein CRG98_040588 [Punica granatum]
MSRSISCPHLDWVTPPLEEIAQIWMSLRRVNQDYIIVFVGDVPLLAARYVDWNFIEAAIAFSNLDHAIFNIQGTELAPTIEEYRTLIARTATAHGIVEPNFHTTRSTLVSRLLGVRTTHLHAELAYSGGTKIAIEKLLIFIKSRAQRVQGDFLRKDICHAFLLIIFGPLLFPRSRGLVDATLASVVLQVVGGREYEVALVAETIRSLDHVSRLCDLISKWIKIFCEIPPKSFKWRAAWMPPGPMALRCPDFNEVPLMSHEGSTTYFQARVMKQFGSLQTVPEDTARTRFEHNWREDQTLVDRQSDIDRVLAALWTVTTEQPYFPGHPTQDKQDFQAIEEYILRFYR